MWKTQNMFMQVKDNIFTICGNMFGRVFTLGFTIHTIQSVVFFLVASSGSMGGLVLCHRKRHSPRLGIWLNQRCASFRAWGFRRAKEVGFGQQICPSGWRMTRTPFIMNGGIRTTQGFPQNPKRNRLFGPCRGKYAWGWWLVYYA